MTPSTFAASARNILEVDRGHARHRAFDRLCEEALEAAGFGEGVAIFEAGVANWHSADDPYPHQGPCPDCERR